MRSNDGPGLVGRLRADLDELVAVDVVALPDAALRSELLELFTAANQINAAIAARIASFDARNLSDDDACKTTAVWVRAYSRCSDRAASRVVKQARVLRELPAVAEAAGRGEVSAEHVGRIGVLVKQVGVAAVEPADQILADAAAKTNPAELGALCERIRDYVDPDGPDPMERFEKRELTLSDVGDMVAIRGQLDPEGGAAVREALDALMRPPAPDDARTAGQRRADALVDLARGALAHGDLPTVGGMRPQVGILIPPEMLLHGPDGDDPRTRMRVPFGDETEAPDISHDFNSRDGESEESGDAANGATEPAPPDGHDGGTRPQPERTGAAGADDPTTSRPAHRVATANPRGDPAPAVDPLAALGVPPAGQRAWLNWYGPVDPATAQRIVCDSDLWRIILDPATGLPLDVGRAYRLVPYWIRRALFARDRGCRWPGCSTPAPWCDAHHLHHWHDGGVTRVEDMLLTCRYHHALLHEGRWRLHLDRATGQVHVTRPDGTPHDLAPTRPWTTPTTQSDDPPDTS